MRNIFLSLFVMACFTIAFSSAIFASDQSIYVTPASECPIVASENHPDSMEIGIGEGLFPGARLEEIQQAQRLHFASNLLRGIGNVYGQELDSFCGDGEFYDVTVTLVYHFEDGTTREFVYELVGSALASEDSELYTSSELASANSLPTSLFVREVQYWSRPLPTGLDAVVTGTQGGVRFRFEGRIPRVSYWRSMAHIYQVTFEGTIRRVYPSAWI